MEFYVANLVLAYQRLFFVKMNLENSFECSNYFYLGVSFSSIELFWWEWFDTKCSCFSFFNYLGV